MTYSTLTLSLAAAIATVPLVSAHGYVADAIIAGKTYFVGNPNWAYQPTLPTQPGWFANNLDNGFVSPDAYGTPDIICHKNATPGNSYLTAAAGTTIGLQWNTWPDSHKGPVTNYLAAVSGDFSTIDKTKLNFFNAQAGALIDDTTPPGTWVTDQLIANNFTGEFTIPASIAPGNYVLRHEIIGLHAAGSANGAQSYPMCINIKITGGGSANPCASGADCRVGTAFYKATDPGILIDIYSKITNYIIPGPALWSGGSSGTSPVSSSSKPTTLVTSTKPALSTTTPAPPTTTSKPVTTTTSKPASSTSKPASSTPSAPSSSCAAKYAQCGGQGWTGPTCCVAGSTCTANGQYYSQCT